MQGEVIDAAYDAVFIDDSAVGTPHSNINTHVRCNPIHPSLHLLIVDLLGGYSVEPLHLVINGLSQALSVNVHYCRGSRGRVVSVFR